MPTKKRAAPKVERDDDEQADDEQPEKEPRGHCGKCGAVKYQKFMNRVPGQRSRWIERWECKDAMKCARRSANYRGG